MTSEGIKNLISDFSGNTRSGICVPLEDILRLREAAYEFPEPQKPSRCNCSTALVMFGGPALPLHLGSRIHRFLRPQEFGEKKYLWMPRHNLCVSESVCVL